jgi:hypothetical protein
MGKCPDWYLQVRAARYLKSVKPWEFEDQWAGWMHRALAAEAAELGAQQVKVEDVV